MAPNISEWWDGAILGGKVAAWEDVCAGEGGGSTDAVKEEDAIG